jgi:hypothetical protein
MSDPWKKETCSHCNKTDHACYLEGHQCLWSAWSNEGATWHEQRGSDAEDVARQYAFHEIGMSRGHWLCDTDGSVIVYVRRKGSAEVIPCEVRGHWQPQYSAHAGKPTPRRTDPP